MVIAERWAEQRVLMRAYAESRDPGRPTIFLHGTELAIGPAGLDLQGPWGIHVGDDPDVRAPFIKEQLETSARRLAGGKGNPAVGGDARRGADEQGAPRVPPSRPELPAPVVQHIVPPEAVRIPPAPPAYAPSGPGYGGPAGHGGPAAAYAPSSPGHGGPAAAYAPSSPGHGGPAAAAPSDAWTAAVPRAAQPAIPARTALGYTSGSGAQSAIARLGLLPHISARLGRLVDRVVPEDFHIDARERRVLNALGDGPLTARGVAQVLDLAVDLADPVAFMDALTRKLGRHHLDLVEFDAPQGREPTYRLRC